MEGEYDFDLYWHALNYRSAAIEHAHAAWLELDACVQRLIGRGPPAPEWGYIERATQQKGVIEVPFGPAPKGGA